MGEFVAYIDPATENIVVRLTDPAHTSHFPAQQNRHVSRRSQTLLFASDRHGPLAPYTLDLKTANLKQLAEPKALRSGTVTLDATEKNCLYVDGSVLTQVSLERGKPKTLAEGVDDFHLGGPDETIVVRQGTKLARLEEGKLAWLADGAASRALVSPAGNTCCFFRELDNSDCALFAMPVAGGNMTELARGRISCPIWDPGSRSVLFLQDTGTDEAPLTDLWEAPLEAGGARVVTRTSRFATFALNGNGSVFVGASRSKAQPHVILALRAVHREMTLCEHKSTRPEQVRPVFSPNSQRVYFESDRHGKPALYTMSVAQLVEPTQAP